MGCLKLQYYPTTELKIISSKKVLTLNKSEKNNRSSYRYGFGNQEKVNEIAGEGNHYTATFWEYDPRLGRRWNLDPVDQISISNYASLGNNPIYYTDLLGDRITPNSDWTADGRKGGRYSHLNLFLTNAMMGEDDATTNTSGRNCSMCCLNALTSNLNFLYSRHGITKIKVANSYDNSMKAIARTGYKGDREIAKATYKGKVATSGDAATLKANMSSSDFNTGIVDNLTDQMKGNAGTFMFGVGIAQGYHSTIIMGMNNGQKMSNVIGADGKAMTGEQTASATNPLFSFIEDGGGVRFFTAQGLENKMKEFVVGAANYYSGNKVIDGKKVSNTAPKNISTTVDNLEYKK